MTNSQNIEPGPDAEISNYCPLCGRTEKRKYSEGNHVSAPFIYRETWWSVGLCNNCNKN
jgi:hypothetical protein